MEFFRSPSDEPPPRKLPACTNGKGRDGPERRVMTLSAGIVADEMTGGAAFIPGKRRMNVDAEENWNQSR
jgi:hypothetical protein